MATFSKQKLSGSTDGRPFLIVATATPGTTVHTAVAGTTGWDEVFLRVWNSNTVATQITIQFGGTSGSDSLAVVVPPGTTTVLTDGWILQNGAVIRAFTTVANVMNVVGWVNRITP